MRLSTLTSISENLSNSAVRFGSSLDKLSSGLKVNKASDDGSGLSISDKLRTQVTSIRSAIDNGNSAVAMLQIADKSMAEQSKILDTVKAKLIQASTDTTSAQGRAAIQKDINKLLTQLDNIASQTNYNGRQLISSSNALSAANTHTFQLGEKSSDSIATTAVQANTSGLPQSLSNVYEITETLGINGSLGFNSSDSNFNVTMTGNVEVDLTGEGGVFKNSGSGNITITVSSGGYEEMVLQTLTTGSFTDGGGGIFTLAPGGTIELVDSGINQPMSFSNMRINMNSSLSVTGGDFTSIVNNAGSLSLSGAATHASVGPTPLLLSDLKNLGTLTETNAKSYQQVVDDSITQLNKYRSDIGSTQNQVQSAVRNLMTQATNLEAAKSTIIDVDYASESATFNKEMIILSAGQFSLTQANTYQSSILSLLQ